MLQTVKMPWGDEMPVSPYVPIEGEYLRVIAEIYRDFGV